MQYNTPASRLSLSATSSSSIQPRPSLSVPDQGHRYPQPSTTHGPSQPSSSSLSSAQSLAPLGSNQGMMRSMSTEELALAAAAAADKLMKDDHFDYYRAPTNANKHAGAGGVAAASTGNLSAGPSGVKASAGMMGDQQAGPSQLQRLLRLRKPSQEGSISSLSASPSISASTSRSSASTSPSSFSSSSSSGAAAGARSAPSTTTTTTTTTSSAAAAALAASQQSCDRCRRRHQKCSKTGPPCAQCIAAGPRKASCTYADQLLRAGRPSAEELALLEKAGVPYVSFRSRLRCRQQMRATVAVRKIGQGRAASTSGTTAAGVGPGPGAGAARWSGSTIVGEPLSPPITPTGQYRSYGDSASVRSFDSEMSNSSVGTATSRWSAASTSYLPGVHPSFSDGYFENNAGRAAAAQYDDIEGILRLLEPARQIQLEEANSAASSGASTSSPEDRLLEMISGAHLQETQNGQPLHRDSNTLATHTPSISSPNIASASPPDTYPHVAPKGISGAACAQLPTIASSSSSEVIDYEERHSAGPDVFSRLPATEEALEAMRMHTYGKLLGGDPDVPDWRLPQWLWQAPVLVGAAAAQAGERRKRERREYVLTFDENLVIQARPTTDAMMDLRTLYDCDWTTLGPRGQPISPDWSALRAGTADPSCIWPISTCHSEEDYDDLRCRAANLLASPVLALLLDLGISQNTDQQSAFLPDVPQMLIEAGRPENSRGCRWTKLKRRQVQAMLLGMAVPATQWYGALATNVGGRQVKVGTWELGAYIFKLAYALLQPLPGQEGPECVTQEFLSGITVWCVAQRVHPLYREMIKKLLWGSYLRPGVHETMLKWTQYLTIEREVYKRMLGNSFISMINYRLWTDMDIDSMPKEFLEPLGLVTMLPAEMPTGASHSKGTYFYFRYNIWLSFIFDEILRSSLFENAPERNSVSPDVWDELVRRRERDGERVYYKLLAWKQSIYDPNDPPTRNSFPSEADYLEWQRHTSMLFGMFTTAFSLVTAPLEEMDRVELKERGEATLGALPDIQPETKPGVVDRPPRSMEWNKACGSLVWNSADFGNKRRGATAKYY